MAATPSSPGTRPRVAIVTGGGGGIGAAVAEALGRAGTFVVTLDPLVSVDGTERLAEPDETTADRIVAAGGSARASSASVTDREGVRRLFRQVAEEHGGLDAVVNVAGITRPTSFASGAEDDWRDVLSVHLDGYRNVLAAALPIMAAAGRGHILGVTSGSGWRRADTGAYGCAKRAVASLTWQLGRQAPPGIVVNAMSPIAMTRMVTSALERARAAPAAPGGGGSSSTGGLSLGSMPGPDELGPVAAHLVGDGFGACRGQVVFVAGSEVAIVEPPRLLEVVGTDVDALDHLLERVTPAALVPAERDQATSGGSNPRLAAVADADPAPSTVARCVVVSDRPDLSEAVEDGLRGRGVACTHVRPDPVAGFDGAARALAEADGDADAVVVAIGGGSPSADEGAGWERALVEHEGLAPAIHTDAGWVRAVAALSERTGRPVRAVTLTDATTAGGRSRAQAVAQLVRAGRGATDERVTAFAVAVEGRGPGLPSAVGALTAHLLCHPATAPLAGAELVVDDGWLGLRSHPRAGAGVVLADPTPPDWLDGVLADLAAPDGGTAR